MTKPVKSLDDVEAMPLKLDPITQHFINLNEQFGELVDGHVLGPDDYVTDPEELAKYPRPTEEEIREKVRTGFSRLRLARSHH